MSFTSPSFDELTKLIQGTTCRLMEYGGTTPDGTCAVIAEKYPDLYKAFGHDRVRKLCEVIQHSDLPKASALLQERFRAFNETYFAGKLPEYEVRVVNDARFWGKKTWGETTSGAVDFGLRTIFIALMRDHSMSDALLHHMAHVATNTEGDDDAIWMAEMERLKTIGAPVIPTFPGSEEPNERKVEVADPPVTAIQYFDQAAKLDHLRRAVSLLSAKPGRVALCKGLLELLDEDVIRYGICHPSSRTYQGYAIVGEPFDMMHVSDLSRNNEDEPITARVLMELILGDMIVVPIPENGEIDLAFYGLDRPGSEVLDKSYFRSKTLKLIPPRRVLNRRAGIEPGFSRNTPTAAL